MAKNKATGKSKTAPVKKAAKPAAKVVAKGAAKKAPAAKKPAAKAAVKTGVAAKKAPVKKVTAKKTASPAKSTTKAAVKKPVAKKTAAPKAPVKTAAKKAAVKAPVVKKAAAKKVAAPAKGTKSAKAVKAPVKTKAPVKSVQTDKAVKSNKSVVKTEAVKKASAAKPVEKAAVKPAKSASTAKEKNTAKPVVKPVTKAADIIQPKKPQKVQTVEKAEKTEAAAPVRKKIEGLTADGLIPPDYDPTKDKGDFMNPLMREFFRQKLISWRSELLRESTETIHNTLQSTELQKPDMADRAAAETDHALELRTRDRERKLISKINEALLRIEEDSYGYCEETGEPITVARLVARPTATLSLEAQERHERMERTHRDD